MIHELFKIFNWMGSEWVLFILIALSIVAGWVILQRFYEIHRLTKVSKRFWKEHGEMWFQNADINSWKAQLSDLKANYPCLESDTLDVIQRAESNKDAKAGQVVQAYLQQRKLKLERYVSILGTIGANAPFIGLLGTVLGIIRAFHNMSVQGVGGGMDNISSGISEALVATAIGLLVAVPAVCFFNLLNKKIAVLMQRAQSVSLLVLSNREPRE